MGKVKSVNSDLIDTLIAKDFIPIIAPIGMDENYQAYNINADDAASAVAKCIHAEKLAFMTDIEGVCKDPKDPETLISVLTTDEAKQLIEDGTIGGGMIPKIDSMTSAIRQGVKKAFIIDGRVPHSILMELLTDEGMGTMFRSR